MLSVFRSVIFSLNKINSFIVKLGRSKPNFLEKAPKHDLIYFKVSHPKPPGDKSQKSKEFKIRSKKIRREGGSLFENLNVYLSSRWYSVSSK